MTYLPLLDIVLVIFIIIGGLYFGFWVFLSNKKEKVNNFFLFFTIAIIARIILDFLFYTYGQIEYALIIKKLVWVSLFLFFIFAYYFSIYFPKKSKRNYILDKIIITSNFIFLIITIFTDWIIKDIEETHWGPNIAIGEGMYLAYIYILILIYLILANIVKKYSSLIYREKLKILYFLVGIILFAFFNVFFNIIFPLITGSFEYAKLGNYSAIFLFGFTAYAIVKKELFDIKVAITSVFVVLIAILLGVDLIFFTEELWIQVVKGGIVVIFILFGWRLIKSVTREIKQKEELEKLAKKLKKTNKKLRELDKLKTEFLSLATHQIRSPLTSMRGYISMILEGDYGEIREELREPLGMVDESSQSLVKVVNDFLNVSRIEQGRMQYDMEERSIKDVVEKVVNEYRPAVEEKGLNIHLEQTDEECMSKLDEYKMEQVIGNLIDNAIKYTPEGEIKIKTSKTEDNMVRIEISDTGVGIKPEEIPKLFAKFQRAKGAEKTNVTGTGLGIYLAQMIARDHGGDVRVHSEGEGKGTTFTVELPAV